MKNHSEPPRQTLQDLKTSGTSEVLGVWEVVAGFWRGSGRFRRFWRFLRFLVQNLVLSIYDTPAGTRHRTAPLQPTQHRPVRYFMHPGEPARWRLTTLCFARVADHTYYALPCAMTLQRLPHRRTLTITRQATLSDEGAK